MRSRPRGRGRSRDFRPELGEPDQGEAAGEADQGHEECFREPFRDGRPGDDGSEQGKREQEEGELDGPAREIVRPEQRDRPQADQHDGRNAEKTRDPTQVDARPARTLRASAAAASTA